MIAASARIVFNETHRAMVIAGSGILRVTVSKTIFRVVSNAIPVKIIFLKTVGVGVGVSRV